MRYKFRYKIKSTHEEFMYIKNWCTENFGETVNLYNSMSAFETKRWTYTHHVLHPVNSEFTIFIKDEEDAMAFKLRWA